MTKMTKLEIIKELFIDGYCKDPSSRAYDGRNCTYLCPKTGNKCVVGKGLLNPSAFLGTTRGVRRLVGPMEVVGENHNSIFNEKEIDTILDGFLDAQLQEKYRGHSTYFWRSLQHLHDEDYNWDSDGLTTNGTSTLNKIISYYCPEENYNVSGL